MPNVIARQQNAPPPGDAGGTRPITAIQIGTTAAKTGRGGMDRYFSNVLRSLPSHAVGVWGMTVGETDAQPDAGVRCSVSERIGILERWSLLRRAVVEALPHSDLVVSHFAPYAFPVLDKIRTRPLVVHFHGPWALESAAEGARASSVASKHVIERIVYARGARFIVLSRAFGAILERHYRVAPELIRVIPGGVDSERFRVVVSRRAAREQLGWPTDRPIVVSARRLVHAKGVENLIDAAAALRRRIPDLLVVIAGTGPLAGELTRRVSERGLESVVRFAGFVPESDLAAMYRAADLFVVPTISLEGFGLVVIEALACGTPVLVTPVAGLPEVLSDLDPALVLPSVDASALARGIGDALTGELPLPSPAACISYARRFDWSEIARRVADVYREVA